MLVLFFTCSMLFAIIEGHPLKDILIKSSAPISVLFFVLFRTKWLSIHKSLFLAIFWMIGFFAPPKMLDLYEEFDRVSLFFVGYLMGITEVILAFSVKNISYRIILQTTLIIGKVMSFNAHLRSQPSLYISLWCVSLLSIVFFFYHNQLDRDNFKTMFNAQQKLNKFQDLIANELPTSIIIISSDLKTIIYSNQCYKDNLSQSQDKEKQYKETIEFFKHLIVEKDARNDIPIEQETMSLYDLVITTLKTASESQSPEIKAINIYATTTEDDNSKRYYEVKLQKIYWEQKSAYTIIMNDVTYNQLFTALKIADEQKDRVLATLSHELKTPINGILGLLDIIKSQILDENCKQYIEHCKNCSKLLLYLINSLLDLSKMRKETLKIEKRFFSLDDLLKEIKSLYTFMSEFKGIKLIIEKVPQAPNHINTDRYRLLEVLIHIIGNAMKFTFKGHVKVSVRLSSTGGSGIVFNVEDTGIGIKEQDKVKLLHSFEQLTNSGININAHGAGIGLAIAGGLITALNKSSSDKVIKFESTVGFGSIFWFGLDIDSDIIDLTGLDDENEVFQEHSILVARANSLSPAESIKFLNRDILQGRRLVQSTLPDRLDKKSRSAKAAIIQRAMEKKVLIVDDNPFNLLAASFMAKKFDFVPYTANNGEECLKMVEESQGMNNRYSFILMDIQMPVMDGMEATKIIVDGIKQGKFYALPIIALTAKAG